MIEKVAKAQARARKKGGFTLVELMVTLAILLMALGLFAQLGHAFYRRYAQIEARWIVQTAARRVMDYFHVANESLSNSTNAAIFYNESTTRAEVDYGTGYPDDRTIATVMKGVPTTGNDVFAYIYTKPAANPELGDVIYVLDRGVGKTPVSLTEEILEEEVPLSISFRMATVPIDAVGSPVAESGEGETTAANRYADGADFLRNTIEVIISTPVSVGGNFTLTTSFTMNNLAESQAVNLYKGGLCATEGSMYIAGWQSDTLPCPVDTSHARMQYANKTGNVLRYVSTESFLNSQNTDTADFNAQGAGLCFGALAMEGSAIGTEVKGSLRDFRDNVLKGNALGEQIIDLYYNDLSPALLAAAEEHPGLLKAARVVLVPTAFVAFFAAE